MEGFLFVAPDPSRFIFETTHLGSKQIPLGQSFQMREGYIKSNGKMYFMFREGKKSHSYRGKL
jgi:hypothetical protein